VVLIAQKPTEKQGRYDDNLYKEVPLMMNEVRGR
jgi:hypothetical protein